MKEDWAECTFDELLDYEQPNNYIVESTNYQESFSIPVLTAGKSFILGYTNESEGIFDKLPAIIFDDFTTASHYVDFKFKVKSSAMKILIPKSRSINLKFVFYSMQVNKVRNDTHKRYWISVFAKNKLKFPPLPIQRAIVNKIENLFTSLDKGIAELKTAQQQLKVYRQAVLKKAFEGGFTHKNLKEGELPKGWLSGTFNEYCLKIGDIDHKMPKQVYLGGLPFISTKDFTDDLKISFDNAKYISIEDFQNLAKKIKPEKGDIIFPRYGTIGKNILVDFEKDFLVSYSCAIIKPNHEKIDSKYLFYFSLSPKVQDEIKKYVVETTQANIGIASIKKFVLDLPKDKSEQNVIVCEIESRLSVCDKIEQSIIEALDKAEALRQSILKKAFEGKLLSKSEIAKCKQEADYEPATELLKKIKTIKGAL